MIKVCHVSGRISASERLTEDIASEMATILPNTIFYFEDNT